MTLSLVPEEEVRCSACSAGIELGPARGQVLQLFLGIQRMSERQTLDILIWGSADGKDWGPRPLAILTRKYYCGNYTHSLDLTDSPKVKFLSVEYRLNRPGALIELHAEMAHEAAMAATA